MSSPPKKLRIGNAAGFWGDQVDAPRRLAEEGDLDFLTLEYLAELTLSILAHLRSKNPESGFVHDFPEVARQLAPQLRSQTRPLRIVTNAGGMNPRACARATAAALAGEGLENLPIAIVEGDDLLERLGELRASGERFSHFETGQCWERSDGEVASANAYLGAAGIVDALKQHAAIVITGRVADASLVVAPAMATFDWSWTDWQRLGAATVAGHLIECGAQVTGGMYSDWHAGISLGDIGYPIVEIEDSGNGWITKPAGTGGTVKVGTVAEQLVYEIGDPSQYFTPDVVADFRHVRLRETERDRVRVEGGRGAPAPDRYKVSMAYRYGYTASGSLALAGGDATFKAKTTAEAIRQRLERADATPAEFHFEVVGGGDVLPGSSLWRGDTSEVLLRVAVRDSRKEVVERFTRELAPFVTSGPPGVTGYTGSRARPRPVLAYWPTTVARNRVTVHTEVRAVKEWNFG